MKILDDLINALSRRDEKVKGVYTCAYFTAVVSKNCGLASTFKDEDHQHRRGVKNIGSLTQKTALELAQYARSDVLLEASIGMAAVNSLIDIDESRCVELNVYDLLAQRGEGKNVALVGHFPFTSKLRKLARNLWVLEKRPKAGDLPEDEAQNVLPNCDIVGITGTTFINHTLEFLLELCKGSFVVMIGPTTPLSQVLFDYGIDVVSGTKVVEQAEVLKCISQGATFREIRGIRLLTMENP
jgi:hypothetical protein